MKKKNICFFLGSFQVGGAEQSVLDIIRNLDKDDFNIFICVFKDDGGLQKQFVDLQIPILSLPFHRINLVAKSFYFYKYIKFLQNNMIDVVHVHLVGCFVFGIKGAKIAGVKTKIITWHGIYDFSRVKKPDHVKYGSLNSDLIISVSKSIKSKNCDSYDIDDAKVKVIYNSIDHKKFDNHYVIRDNVDEFIIGAVGNLREEKGYKYLLEGYAFFAKKVPNSKLLIIGSGNLRSELIRYSKTLNINHKVQFMGQRDDIDVLIKSFDIWVMSSIYEGFSIALLEAMASSLPIIATNVGGNDEAILNNQSGIIIPPKDSINLGNSLKFLHDHPKKRLSFSVEAKKRFNANFKLEIMMSSLVEVYNGEQLFSES